MFFVSRSIINLTVLIRVPLFQVAMDNRFYVPQDKDDKMSLTLNELFDFVIIVQCHCH